MGIWRLATFSRNAGTLACVGNRLSSPEVRHCRDRAWSPPRADDSDRRRPLHDDLFALSISAPRRVAARLVVGPDDVRDGGVGNERHDTLAPSGNGVGSEVDGGHSKSSSGPRSRLRASVAGPPQRCRPFVLTGRLYGHPDARLKPRTVTSSGKVIQPCPTRRWPTGSGNLRRASAYLRKSSARPNPRQTLHQG